MSLPPAVHDLQLTTETPVGDQQFHPAAIEAPTGLLLVDVVMPGHADTLGDALGRAGFGFEDVHSVLLTHQDGDHAGCLATVRERVADAAGTEPAVYAHVADAPSVDGRTEPIKHDGSGERYPPSAVDVELVDGVIFRTEAGPVRVVATPGHTPGHVSLYLPDERLLLAADALTVDDLMAGIDHLCVHSTADTNVQR